VLTGGAGRYGRPGPWGWEQPVLLSHLWEKVTKPQNFPPFGDLAHGLWIFLQAVLGCPVFVELIPHGPSLGPCYWLNPILSRFFLKVWTTTNAYFESVYMVPSLSFKCLKNWFTANNLQVCTDQLLGSRTDFIIVVASPATMAYPLCLFPSIAPEDTSTKKWSLVWKGVFPRSGLTFLCYSLNIYVWGFLPPASPPRKWLDL
jgi:hypothetical protein